MNSITAGILPTSLNLPITLTPNYVESPESSPIQYYSSEEEPDVDYLCPKCTNPRINDRWCKHCESKRLSEEFQNWTSNNEILDEFIRDTQRNATKNQDYLVWIDYDKLEGITYLDRGGFSDVYYGVWVDGPERKFVKDEGGNWILQAKTPVALKCLHNSEKLTLEFLNELKAYYKCRKGSVLRCYGITQHKTTKNYILVMKFASEGDLRHFLSHYNSTLTWGSKLRMLKDIALGLEEIHSMKLIHRDFHSGNILHTKLSDGTIRTFVTDLGLCRPVNQTLKNISEKRDVYGVMPYIAPEILRRTHDYSVSSDIYSFGMIMWEILHGKPPFNDVPHDVYLAIRICEGLRPKIEKKGVPKWYISLMIKCWDKDPLKRPDTFEVRKIIANSYLKERHCDDVNTTNIPHQVRKVKRLSRISSHPQAVFTSRLLNYSNLPQPRDVPDISEYSSCFSSNCEEQDVEDNKIKKIEESEEFKYVTRAFDETLSFEDDLDVLANKDANKRKISSNQEIKN
ncbi:kinase-like domain-containing protein [Glomus cerebriforme]|uniref:Kinase-like domain-containing protein n=1 Tax=Glomus cerebriforme TaxID=658196 RepID=A0A397SAU3_9GLOM|nr:kinase-like domain-containing protein [Glomus cerebriforme]